MSDHERLEDPSRGRPASEVEGAPPRPPRRRPAPRGPGTARSPERGLMARGVLWLGVPEGEDDQPVGERTSPRDPALHLLGYPHGPRILDALRSGGR